MDEIAAAGFPVGEPSLGHLWFLYYLLYFYLTIPLCFLLSRWSLKLKLEKFIVSPAMFVALSLGTIATLWSFRGGVVFEGFIFIKPYLPSLFYYGSFFVIGYLFHSHRVILQSFARFLPWTTALSLLLFPAAVYLTNLDLASEATGEFHLYSVTANAFLTWSLIYMFMGLFLRFFDYSSPWTLYVSNSSYWIYLIHMPIVAFFGWVMLPFDIPAIPKFLVVISATTALCGLSFHYLVQKSFVSDLLSGRRFDLAWPWQETAKTPADSP